MAGLKLRLPSIAEWPRATLDAALPRRPGAGGRRLAVGPAAAGRAAAAARAPAAVPACLARDPAPPHARLRAACRPTCSCSSRSTPRCCWPRSPSSAAPGCEVTDEMRVLIAAQAALLLLNRRAGYFPNLRQVLRLPRRLRRRPRATRRRRARARRAPRAGRRVVAAGPGDPVVGRRAGRRRRPRRRPQRRDPRIRAPARPGKRLRQWRALSRPPRALRALGARCWARISRRCGSAGAADEPGCSTPMPPPTRPSSSPWPAKLFFETPQALAAEHAGAVPRAQRLLPRRPAELVTRPASTPRRHRRLGPAQNPPMDEARVWFERALLRREHGIDVRRLKSRSGWAARLPSTRQEPF